MLHSGQHGKAEPTSDLTLMTAHALSDAIHTQQVSCREVMASTLARIERINPRWNAIVSLREADVLLAEAEARDLQQRRQGCANAFLDLNGLRSHCLLEAADQAWLETACERLNLSLRAAHRLLKVARTLADLEGVASIARGHLGEALQYRPGS